MGNANISTHQTHLQEKDGWVGIIIGKDEFNRITISRPHNALAKEHMAALVHGPITRESFPKMSVEHLDEEWP